MSLPDSREFLDRLQKAEPECVELVLAHFRPMLVRVVAAHLPSRLRSRLDPEDVVQLALASFWFRLTEDGYQFAALADVHHLLVVIAQDKTRQQIREHHAACRDFDRETEHVGAADERRHMIDPADTLGDPIDAAVANDTLESALKGVPPLHQEMIRGWLESRTLKEIAQRHGCNVRRVSQVIAEFRKRVESANGGT